MTRTHFNPKRRLRGTPLPPAERDRLLDAASYAGNPAHKRNPGDFGLTPPSSPRPDKTLCDPTGVLERGSALRLLREGIRRGMVSAGSGAGARFPRNIWAVDDEGVAFEAQLENPERGTYHGYPMPSTDPFRTRVLERWRGSHD